MTISGITSEPAAAPAQLSDKTLDIACREFEGMLLGTILKQGIVPRPDENEEEGTSNNTLLTEFAAEQMARAMSSSDATGIAAMLKRQLHAQGTRHE